MRYSKLISILRIDVVLGIILIALFSGNALGQVTGAVVTGQVTAPDHAAVSGATVTLTNAETGVQAKTSSNTEGIYEFPPVNPGTYQLTVNAAGFANFLRSGIFLEMQQRVRVDVEVQISKLQQTVEVSGTPTVLDTETADKGNVLEGDVVKNLPFRGRDVYMITRLVAGGNPTYEADPFSDSFDTFAPSSISFNGAPIAGNLILMDGVTDTYGNGPIGFNPSQDAVQEVNVQTLALNAAYGETSGTVTSMETKQGTNTPHGELYEYHSDPGLDSNTYFGRQDGLRKAHSIINQFGGMLGGPVYIPKVYDGKNRTFFFFGYEGIWEPFGYLATSTVPTALQRTGDFSQTLAGNASPITIYDPLTTQPGTLIRTAFPGNVIPADRINPIAMNILKYYPLPNLPGDANNFVYNHFYTEISHEYQARVDHHISSNQSLTVSFGSLYRTEHYNASLPTLVTGDNYKTQDKFLAVSDTYVFNPATLFVVRIGVLEDHQPVSPLSSAADFASLGFPGSYTSILQDQPTDFPSISGSDQAGIGVQNSGETQYPWDGRASITRIQGKHSIDMGYEYRLFRDDSWGDGGEAGSFAFNRDWTQGPDASVASATAGYGFATFLLGDVSAGSVSINSSRALQTIYNAVYVQDTWRASSRLTLDLGLRYDHETPTTDRHNRLNGPFDASAVSPIGLAAQAAYAQNPVPQLPELDLAGGLTFVGVNGQSRYNSISVWDEFMPRIGFAWQAVPNRLVLRGGYGLFYAPLRNIPNNYPASYDLPNSQTGFSATTTMATSVGGVPLNTLSDPFPGGQALPTGSSLGLATALGQSISSIDPNFRRPRTHQFQFGTQYALPYQTLLDLAYVGSRSDELQVNQSLNGIPVQYLSLGNALLNQVPNPFQGLITTGALSTPTISVEQLLNAYPQYTGVTIDNSPIGSAWYNSLQGSVGRRLQGGLSLLLSYTYSKTMQELDRLYFSEPLEREVSPVDRPQRLVFSGEWDVPVGKGMRFGNALPKPILYTLGNWQATWVYTYASGQPLSVGNAILIGTPHSIKPTVNEWFDTTLFAPLPPYTVPTLSTNLSWLRADSTTALDLTVAKDIPIYENLLFRLQGQAYNLSNTTQFAAPNTSVTSPAFGEITGQANQPRWIQVSGKLIF